ncbi:MAG: hypothetical protein MR868_05415 [Lachnospiraceae bacterium]|nr:hypothetical protein [Lachnospiraceae bacterium]
MKQICEKLLREWCGALLKLQIMNTEQPTLKGGILCPACGMIHGRCFDAIYPFLYLADTDQDERYLEAAILLFEWAEHTVSREDGSYVNDINSQWKGTTVFSVIQLIEALRLHGHLLKKRTYEQWKQRVAKAADFLSTFSEFEVCNVNYRIACSFALELCAEYFDEERYRIRARELAQLAVPQLTESGLLIGEGRPTDGVSPRGCRPMDVGYNLEESLPVFLQYAKKVDDCGLQDRIRAVMKRHLLFMLDDGGMDNSFGTRNYKWTYWGSRTSDGCILGYLLAADQEPDFGIAAYKNLMLLKACTHEGILYGGLHLYKIRERPCIHHTFSHAKVLAEILDQGLASRLRDGQLPRGRMKQVEYIRELDTCFIPGADYTATVTAYDWEYVKLPGGHAAGGTLSLLWHEKAGLILCAGMSQYSLKEPYNMTFPRFVHHECITPRLVCRNENIIYSNMYDENCEMRWTNETCGAVVEVQGNLTSLQKQCMYGGEYRIRYGFEDDRIHVTVHAPEAARWMLPVISVSQEEVIQENNSVTIRKDNVRIKVIMEQGTMGLPDGSQRIYNLVPGVEALQIEMKPVACIIAFYLSFCYDNR